jgi:hypothetical protein
MYRQGWWFDMIRCLFLIFERTFSGNSVKWNTEEYDTHSGLALSAANGSQLFIRQGSN